MSNRWLMVLFFVVGLACGYFARELILLRADQENAALETKIEQTESEISKIQSELDELEIEASNEINEDSFTNK